MDRGRRWTLGLAEGHALALHRIARTLRQVGLAGEDDLARRPGPERVALADPAIGALGLQDEVELLLAGVVPGHIEGVARHKRAGGFVREARDAEGLVHAGELPGELVEGREPADALLPLLPDAGRPHRRGGELREGEQALAVDRVEGAVGVGGGDADAADDLAVEHHRRGHRRMDPGLAQEFGAPARLAVRVDGVVAKAHHLAASDHPLHEGPDLLRRGERSREPDAGEVDRGLASQLGHHDELRVVRPVHLLRDAADHVGGGAGLGRQLARHGLDPARLLEDAGVAQCDRRVRREPLERVDVVLVERPHRQTAHGERRRDLALHHDRHADDRAHADVLDLRHRRRVRRVVVPRHGLARAQDRADDAPARRRADTDGALTGARAGHDGEFVTAAAVDRGVVRVDEEQCVARDRPEQRLRCGLLPDLRRDALKAAREPSARAPERCSPR